MGLSDECDLRSWSEAAVVFSGDGDSEPSTSPSVVLLDSDTPVRGWESKGWSQAAEGLLISSQEEQDDIEEACAYRIDSESDMEHDPVVTPSLFLPELYWAPPLLACLEDHFGRGGLADFQVQVASTCSGTLAEASVLQDWGFRAVWHTCSSIYQ